MLDLSPSDITEGKLTRALLVLAAPLLVQNVVQVGQQVVDLFWLGRLSGSAVAAIGLVFPVLALIQAIAIFAPFVGTQVLVSQYVGGENRAEAGRSFANGLVLATVLGLVLGLVVYLGAGPLIELLTATRPESVAGSVPALAAGYLGVLALGLPLLALSDTTEAGFIGWGDSRASLYMNLTAVLINLVLDPILIFGLWGAPALGIEGAALATVISYSIALVLGMGFIWAGRNGRMLPRTALELDYGTQRELLDVGLPTAAQQGTRQLVRVLIVVVVFTVGGPVALAAYIVGGRVASIAFIPAMGLQQAAQSIVGQNLGAERPDRARSVTWLGVGIAAGTLGVIGLVQWFVPDLITLALVPDIGPEAMALSILYLQILAIGYPAIGATYLLEGGFNGARRTKVSFAATILQYAGVRLPIAVGVGLLMGVGIVAVFWAVTISNVVAAIGLAIYYRQATADGMLRRAMAQASAD